MIKTISENSVKIMVTEVRRKRCYKLHQCIGSQDVCTCIVNSMKTLSQQAGRQKINLTENIWIPSVFYCGERAVFRN